MSPIEYIDGCEINAAMYRIRNSKTFTQMMKRFTTVRFSAS